MPLGEVDDMHFYRHHIGDYRKDTVHLTLLEHGAYRQLIDLYYLDEKPLPTDDAKVMRLACARTKDEKEAVKNVLSDFFEKTPKGYTHKRCDSELNRIYEKSEKARQSARVRWPDKGNAKQSDSERNANASKSHERNEKTHANDMLPSNPVTHNKNNGANTGAFDASRFDTFWQEYPNKRDKQKALNAFKKLNPDDDLLAKMISGVQREIEWRKQCTGTDRFVPEWKYGQGWISGRRWEDELSNPEPEASAPQYEELK
jgi:uncharacterized protein YdaU (DUF1376 family)